MAARNADTDRVKETFKAFDANGDGRISLDELKTVLQACDKDLWTDAKVEELLQGADSDKDGSLQFTEFWAWLVGSGPKGDDFNKIEFDKVVEADRADRNERQKVLDEKRAIREAKEAAENNAADTAARKAAEREAGTRISKGEFVESRVAVGISRRVANELFQAGDQDHDGELERQELSELLGAEVQSVEQIRELLRRNCSGDHAAGTDEAMQEMVSSFRQWDTDGDGTISEEELLRVVKALNPKLGQKTTEMMMKQADASHDGFVDILEFVGWVSGVNPKKKKAQEDRVAQAALALHRQRAEEARDATPSLQREFEELQHERVTSFCQKKKITPTCMTLNAAGTTECAAGCKEKHAWICHSCGFVSFYPECVNECGSGYGWTCITDKHKKSKCGCKRKPDFWKRSGFAMDFDAIQKGVKVMLEESKAAAAPAEGA